ncbi:MAG: hypothetical protein JXA03_05910 [Bacteroidales bacterium]|nr:hypothetical protein [Bacteroidales bacterium]
MSFGKNRVQYNEFYWTFYKYKDFDVYHYLGGQELALYTARAAEKYIKEIEGIMDTGLDDKIQFIVFNSLSDLKQSNIGLVSDERYNTGGITHIVGKKVFLYFDGSHRNFNRQIKSGIAQSIVNILLYGSSIGSQIKNTSLFPYPEWYIEGLVSYLSEDWSTETDSRVRDGILSGKFNKFNHLTGEEAIYAGHAFWNYIANRYGESSISNIIYMAKVSRKLESGFLYILGISFKSLVEECLDYYRTMYGKDEENREMPAGSLIKKIKPSTVYFHLKVSPDGGHAAYATNQSGQYKLWLHDLYTGKRKKLMKAGFRIDEKVDYSYPLMAWHPSGRILAILIEKKGEIYLYYYSLDEKKSGRVILYQFEKVLDLAYSGDGRKLAMSAVQRGQSDIFVYDIGSNSYDQVTKDHFDDLNPRFIRNSEYILFSSNRFSDTIRFENKYNPVETQGKTDLFLYDYARKDNILRRVTSTPGANEMAGMEYETGKITFLSDEYGLYNRYIGWFDSTINYIDTAIHYRYFTNYYPITNYSRNILEHDYAPGTGKFGQVVFHQGNYVMQIHDITDISGMSAISPEKTGYMQNMAVIEIKNKQKEQDEKGAQKGDGQPKKGFSSVKVSELLADTTAAAKEYQKTINIHDYNFGTQQQIPGKDGYSVIRVPLPGQGSPGGDEPPKRLNYNVEYFLNEITTQIDFSFLNATYQPFTGGLYPVYLNPGFNALIKVGVTDLLEDYRITGGVRINLNLINNEYLLSFANLKKRLDKEIVFHRQAVENYYGYDIVRVYSHELFYILKWPFNPVMSVKGTFSYRNDMAVNLSTESTSLRRPNFYQNWLGLKAEFIYDNTKNLGLNLYHGTRYKIFGENYQLADDLNQNLIVVGFDYRNYQRLYRTFIWANRIAGSSSYGNNRLIYYLGGVDNWLVPKFNRTTPVDFSQNYTYQTLATNMRGFNQNIRNGTSFAVINTELRFPLFRFFANQPLKSDFLNNFQIVGFADAGTAWTGPDPYSEDNFLYTNIIDQNPLHITVKQQKDPLVAGFGGGLRTRLLGYFIRADLAWGIEDREVQPSVFYFSLSLDF